MFGTASYSYDVLDNLTHVQVTAGAQARNQDYVYDAANRLTNVMAGGLSVIGLGYDVQGNLANRNGEAYAFDYGNRMRTGGPETYRYDVQGRRIRSSSSAGVIYSLYAQSGQLLFQRDERSSKRRQYIYLGGSLVAESDLPLVGTTATVTYQHTDALGSPVATTNSAKAVLQRSEYEPYGYLLNRPMEDGPGYTGHVTDAATGLVYMQQRYYDPALGSFLSIDPIDFDPSTGVGFNRYTYTGDNPYNRIDPDGRNWFNVNDNWEWHKGSNFTGSDGTKYTSSYTHLLVLRAIGTTSTGATKFAATLLNQKSVVSKGTYFSGGNGYDRIPSGNYTIRGDIHNDNPTQVDPNSPAKNPPPAYGIQPISDTPLPDPSTGKYYDVYGAYGPIRAYLNPWNSSTPNSRGNYLHGQAASGESAHGWTHGCMCYGQNTEIITKIWNLGIRIPVTIK